MDRDRFFPQNVPVRERKVQPFRQLPDAVKADPPPLTTALSFGTSEKELADPYNLAKSWIGEDKIPTGQEPGWRCAHTALKRECSLCAVRN